MTKNLTEAFEECYEAGLSEPVPEWFKRSKKDAWTQFQATGLPTRKEQDWKYTSLNVLQNSEFSRSLLSDILGILSDKQNEIIRRHCKDDAINLVLINGQFVPEFSDRLNQNQGFYCQSIRSALQENPDLVSAFKSELQQSVKDNGLTLLNSAADLDGLFLTVDEEKVLNSPVHILNFYFNDKKNARQIVSPRHMILAQKRSSLRIYEEHISLDSDKTEGSFFYNGVCDVILKDHAQLQYRQVLTAPEGSQQILHTRVLQSAHSVFDSFSACAGGQLVRHSQQIWQKESEAFSKLNGLFLGHSSKQCEQLTEVNHSAPFGKSEQLFKGVLPSESTGVFLGTIRVAKDAQKVNARQLSKSLLCSLNAKVHSRPQLEIDADDVKCSHGSTVSQLRDEELFYCQSRGIGVSDARALLSLAFAEDVLLQCQDVILDDLMKPLMNSFRASVTQMRKTMT